MGWIEVEARTEGAKRPRSIKGEARTEGAKRPRIEGEARIEDEARDWAGEGSGELCVFGKLYRLDSGVCGETSAANVFGAFKKNALFRRDLNRLFLNMYVMVQL